MRKLYRLFVTVAVFTLLTISFALLLNLPNHASLLQLPGSVVAMDEPHRQER